MSSHEPDRTADYPPPSAPPEAEADASTRAVAPAVGSALPEGVGMQMPVTLVKSDKPAVGSASPEGVGTVGSAVLPEIPGYEVMYEIARGGMGVVYRARHLRLNRPAAIKMILGGKYHDPDARVRFLIEAEAVAQLDHPNVVHVHEFGTHDNLPYFALEYVAGGTLAEKLVRDGKSAPRAAADLVVKLADGIAAAHAKGIVHRDLKPANVLLTEGGEPKVTDFGLAKVGGSKMTATGAVMGTPSYMSPEQAAGRVREVGTHSDVYALGAILYELLTGRAPFKGASMMETIQLVLTHEPVGPRTIDLGIPRDLETVCLKCLAKEPKKRYATADALAADLRAYLDGRPITARPVGIAERVWKWVKRKPGRAAAMAAVIAVCVGVGIAANEVREQREADRFAAERQRADDRIAAEEKRAGDLRAAAERARREQRETKAAALVQALAVAEPGAVPVLLKELAEYRVEARPHLRELADRPIEQRAGLHWRLARLTDPELNETEASQSRQHVVSYFLRCRADELPLLLDQLAASVRKENVPQLWAFLSAAPEQEPALRNVRRAAFLARLDPGNPEWIVYADTIAKQMVRLNPLEVEPFAEALRPVRGHLVPSLLKRYPESRKRIESGKLATSDLVAEASAFDLTANLLARYAADRPEELAELAVIVDPRHFALFGEAIRNNKAAVASILKAELAKKPQEGASDADLDSQSKRQGNAAAALMNLGEAESVWPVFAFPKSGDPGARSYLLERLAAIRADPLSLVKRFGKETDVSAKRALLIALGDFPAELLPAGKREPFLLLLLDLYRKDPDPGLHSAIDWLLRQKWGKAKELASIDAELAAATRSRIAARALEAGPMLPAPRVAVGKDWFVNGEGQTYAVVRGPVEFTLGSPETEPGRYADTEPAHRKRISRTFAISTKEVTNAEFLRQRPDHKWIERYSPASDTPAVSLMWYECAEYCNWLSKREGIPQDQWCYAPNAAGKYGEGMTIRPGHLSLTGYRMPTEAEWEYACRAGSIVARPFGRGEELLPRYGWHLNIAEDRMWPVGKLRPNDLGLFDVLGNAFEWVEEPGGPYVTGPLEDMDNDKAVVIEARLSRLLRGGGFQYRPIDMRSAYRSNGFYPDNRGCTGGLRPTRTLLK